VGGVLMLVAGALTLVYIYFVRDRIEFSARLLEMVVRLGGAYQLRRRKLFKIFDNYGFSQ